MYKAKEQQPLDNPRVLRSDCRIAVILIAAEDFVRLLTLDAICQRDNEIRDAARPAMLIARVAVTIFCLDRRAADAARHLRLADDVP
jgi:hypothetical protein